MQAVQVDRAAQLSGGPLVVGALRYAQRQWLDVVDDSLRVEGIARVADGRDPAFDDDCIRTCILESLQAEVGRKRGAIEHHLPKGIEHAPVRFASRGAHKIEEEPLARASGEAV